MYKNNLKIYNENYMLVDYNSLSTVALEAINVLGEEGAKEITDEIGKMLVDLARFECDNDTCVIREFLIRTSTATAKFLLNNEKRNNIMGVDAYISYENVTASYLKAICTHNSKMANKIEPLLISRTCGFISEFDKYEYNVLEYIKENGSLQEFLENKTSAKRVRKEYNHLLEPYDEYPVFENDIVTIKTLKRKL